MGSAFRWMVLDKAIAIGGLVYADQDTVHSLGPCHAPKQPTLRPLASCLDHVSEDTAGVIDRANLEPINLNGWVDARVGPKLFCRTGRVMVLPPGMTSGDDWLHHEVVCQLLRVGVSKDDACISIAHDDDGFVSVLCHES
jgi:hypothetical protein